MTPAERLKAWAFWKLKQTEVADDDKQFADDVLALLDALDRADADFDLQSVLVAEMKARIEKLEGALSFYAEGHHYKVLPNGDVDLEPGNVAREALGLPVDDAPPEQVRDGVTGYEDTLGGDDEQYI